MTEYDGVQFPCRAVVISSRADAQGYRATVNVLDGEGERTDQTIEDIPLDPLWLGDDGRGVYAPPQPEQVVTLHWEGGSAGHPVMVAGAPRPAAVPQREVGADEWVLTDGHGAVLRLGADSTWTLRDADGAEVAVDPLHLWRIASTTESLYDVLRDLIMVLQEARTVPDHDTYPGGTGAPLGLGPATIAALGLIGERLATVLR